MEIHFSELKAMRPPARLYYALVAAKENGRVLHGYILHVPALNENERDPRAGFNRAGAAIHHARSVVTQMYMSTTRGLTA